MQWKANNTKPIKDGKLRTRKKFALMPVLIPQSSTRVWLEYYYIEEEFKAEWPLLIDAEIDKFEDKLPYDEFRIRGKWLVRGVSTKEEKFIHKL